MEPAQGSLKLTLRFGDLEVIEAKLDTIVLALPGGKNFIRLHVPQVPHRVKVGDKLPLFTEVPYAARN